MRFGEKGTRGPKPNKIARLTLTIKLDGNWNSFEVANSAPPLSVADRAIAPSARMRAKMNMSTDYAFVCSRALCDPCSGNLESHHTELGDTLFPRKDKQKKNQAIALSVTLLRRCAVC